MSFELDTYSIAVLYIPCPSILYILRGLPKLPSSTSAASSSKRARLLISPRPTSVSLVTPRTPLSYLFGPSSYFCINSVSIYLRVTVESSVLRFFWVKKFTSQFWRENSPTGLAASKVMFLFISRYHGVWITIIVNPVLFQFPAVFIYEKFGAKNALAPFCTLLYFIAHQCNSLLSKCHHLVTLIYRRNNCS